MIKNVLFDLDGTLLPMDMEEFTGGYFKLLAKKAAPFGYEAEKLINTIWGGVKAMVMNDGKKNNEEAFWDFFTSVYGEEARKDKKIFDEFYANEFSLAKQFTGYNEKAKEAVNRIKNGGYNVALATNPLFPDIATRKRANWAGLDVEDFLAYTVYENSSYCKPNPKYYMEFLERLQMKPEECLMVGNDVEEDMEAGLAAGMNVFLLTDCLLNPKERDLEKYPKGSFNDLLHFLNL